MFGVSSSAVKHPSSETSGKARAATRTSIGELRERSLHRALKERYAANGGRTEAAVDGYVADVVLGNRIIEIQTGDFSSLKRKLPPLLANHEVTLVHPIAKDRYLVKRRGDPQAPAKRRLSPRHGSPFGVFGVLTSIPSLLEHPNLTLEIVMVIEEEIRVPNEGRRRWRREWVAADHRLLEVVETHTVRRMADLFAMVDAGLPDRFTTRHLAEAMQSSRRLGQQAAFCFREAGVSEICGKEDRALLYRRRPLQGASARG